MNANTNTKGLQAQPQAPQELKTLEEIITANKLSIANVAAATNVSYALLRKKSKEPISGQIYDPNSVNYQAMAECLKKQKVDLAAIDWSAAAQLTSSKASKALKEFTFKVGDRLYSSYHKATFEIVYLTKEYVCIMVEGSDKPNVLHINTLMACRIKPVSEQKQEQ